MAETLCAAACLGLPMSWKYRKGSVKYLCQTTSNRISQKDLLPQTERVGWVSPHHPLWRAHGDYKRVQIPGNNLFMTSWGSPLTRGYFNKVQSEAMPPEKNHLNHFKPIVTFWPDFTYFIEYVITMLFICWFHWLTVQNKNRLTHTVKVYLKIPAETIRKSKQNKKSQQDPPRPLPCSASLIWIDPFTSQTLPSWCKTQRRKTTFVPKAA